jgi:amino acid transporter
MNGDPDEGVVVATPDGECMSYPLFPPSLSSFPPLNAPNHLSVLNRNASDYPYKSHLQWFRAAYALFGCILFILFNGWRSLLKPFSTPDFLAGYLAIPIFVVVVAMYHGKDEVDWRFWKWGLRASSMCFP